MSVWQWQRLVPPLPHPLLPPRHAQPHATSDALFGPAHAAAPPLGHATPLAVVTSASGTILPAVSTTPSAVSTTLPAARTIPSATGASPQRPAATTAAALPTALAGSYHKSRARVSYVTCPRIIRHEDSYLPSRADGDAQRVATRHCRCRRDALSAKPRDSARPTLCPRPPQRHTAAPHIL